MFKHFRIFFLSIVFALVIIPPNAPALEWLDESSTPGWWELGINKGQLLTNSICSKSNHTPVGSCFDWVTGPGSSENSGLIVSYQDASSNWKQAKLYETDQGWPVMSPDGKKLELMAYGDSFALNPAYNETNRQADIQKCVSQPASDPEFQAIENKLKSKSLACEYWLAMKNISLTTSEQPIIPVFTNKNNVVFYDAEIDKSLLYHIKFKKHLYQKMVLRNAMESWYKGNFYNAGVYTKDYFYVCPSSQVYCADNQKVLHFVTGTVFWTTNPSLTDEEKHFKLSRHGAGIYRFGNLSAKKNAAPGCRHRFSPDSVVSASKSDPSCYSAPTKPLQPAHPLYWAAGKQINHTDNPHVLWGWGTKLATVVVMHGFEDKYHDTGIKPTPFSTNDYIYFIGSGEHTSSIDTKTNSAVYTPTNKIYIARVLATEDAIRTAKIEYFTGIVNAQSQWGAYSQAKPVLSAAPVTVSSFTKRFGKYYLAAACSFYGMCVGESVDGYSWTNPQTAVYTDISPNQDGPTVMVYGNAWVPEALYSHSKAIPYTFSVWKSFGPNFMGYFYDFWFQGGNKAAVAPEKRFSFYNTKMNLYWTAGP